MVRNFILLFLALRAADLLNLAGGIWLVPKHVAPEDLGAVLPLTTFATLVAIPLYAIAMTALREAARLRALNESPRPLIRGVFAAVGVTAIFALILAAALLPRFLVRFRVADSLSGYLAVAAAFLGCVSPVYLDQLQAAKRFGTVSVVEIAASATRLAVMAALMPFRALAGYFAGSLAKPLVQILAPLLTLCRGGRLHSATSNHNNNYWTRHNFLRLGKDYILMLAYIALPMLVSFTESDIVRTLLPAADSAGYYMATRISDLMNYLTYPILFVMFPYVTDNSVRGQSSAPIVRKSVALVFAVAAIASGLTLGWGAEIVALMPNGENYAAYAGHLPTLIAFMAFGASQTIVTNAEVAAGRFAFLWWLAPLQLVYVWLLPQFLESPSLGILVTTFLAFAAVRFLFAIITTTAVVAAPSPLCQSGRGRSK